MARAYLRKLVFVILAASTHVAFVPSFTSAFASTTSAKPSTYAMQELMVDNTNQISLIVSPHGNMAKIPIDAHFMNDKREFEVKF